MSFLTNAIEHNKYWYTQKNYLVLGLILTYRDVVWDDINNMSRTSFLDGTIDSIKYGGYGRTPISHGAQVNLGRLDEPFQQLLKYYTPSANTFNVVVLAVILLNNQVILNNETPVYPEDYWVLEKQGPFSS